MDKLADQIDVLLGVMWARSGRARLVLVAQIGAFYNIANDTLDVRFSKKDVQMLLLFQGDDNV